MGEHWKKCSSASARVKYFSGRWNEELDQLDPIVVIYTPLFRALLENNYITLAGALDYFRNYDYFNNN